jgi:hypothetical protein
LIKWIFTYKGSLTKWVKYYFIDIILILIIPLISLWGYLFFKGYYFYSDQNWPLSNNLYENGILSLNSLQGFTFSRLIIDWPYYLITLFTKSVEITERIFIYYTFVLYTFFSYVLASMITSKLLKTKDKYEIKLIKFIIVIFIFSNFTALNLNADGGSYSDGLNIIFISMILFAFVAWNNMRFAFVLSAILLTISILVEPDYTSFYIIAILVGSAIAGILNKDFVYRVKYAILSIGSVVIPFLFIIYGIYITSSTGSSISTLGAIRVYNYGTIAFFSANIKPLYPLILIGHFWSTIVYAPPNILLYGDKISSVKALMQPSQLLLPAGLITDVWLFSLIMIPILSLTSITFKRTRKIVVPVFILFLIMYALSLVNYIKPIFYFEYYLSSIPIFGGSIGTTLSLPGHVINVIAGIYYILFSVTLIELFNKNMEIHIRFTNRKYTDIGKSKSGTSIFAKSFHISETQIRVIIVFFITFIVLFSGWEAFDGTFYPARAPDSIYGNHVGSVGGFTPMQINSSVISVYDFISAQKSDFNILWIGGPEYNNRVYEPPHPTVSIPDLSYITSNNMTCNFYYSLLQSNTKYVVVSNQNIVKNAANIFEESFSDAGFKNFSKAKAFLDEVLGLKEIYNKNQVVVYQVKNFSTMYESNILINCNANNPEYVALPYLFNSMGYKPSLTLADTGIKFQFNNNTNNSVESPAFLFSHYTKINDTTIFNLNSNKTILGAGHNYFTGIYDNYTLTLWSNNETYYNYSDGITDIHMTGNYNYGTSVSYNGSFNNGPGGFFNNNNYVKLKVTFYAKSSVKGEDKIIFMGEPKTNIRTDNVYYGRSFNVTNDYKKYTFSYTFTNAEQYLDFRIFDYNPGTFYLKNLSVEYSTLPKIVENSSMPFGNCVVLNNTLLKGGNKTAFIFIKNSTSNNYKWLKFNYSKGFCIKNNADVGALILLNNVNALNQKSNSYMVSIYPSLKDYELKYNDKYYKPVPGIYGNSIYILSGNISSLKNAKIVIEGGVLMDAFYIGIILYLMVLTYFMIDIYRKNGRNF